MLSHHYILGKEFLKTDDLRKSEEMILSNMDTNKNIIKMCFIHAEICGSNGSDYK